jgi:hypothetical protein
MAQLGKASSSTKSQILRRRFNPNLPEDAPKAFSMPGW